MAAEASKSASRERGRDDDDSTRPERRQRLNTAGASASSDLLAPDVDKSEQRRQRGLERIKAGYQGDVDELTDLESTGENEIERAVRKERISRSQDIRDLWEEALEIRSEMQKQKIMIDDTQYDLQSLARMSERRFKAIEQALKQQLDREERVRITLNPTKKCTGREWHGTSADTGKTNEIINAIQASANLAPKIDHYDPSGKCLYVFLKRSDHKQAVEEELKVLLKPKGVMPTRTKLEISSTLARPIDFLQFRVKRALQTAESWPLEKDKALVQRDPIGFESPGYSLGAKKDGTFLSATIETKNPHSLVPYERMVLSIKEEYTVDGHKFDGGKLKKELEEHLSKVCYPWSTKINLVPADVQLAQAPTRAELKKQMDFEKGKSAGKGSVQSSATA